MNNMSMLMWIVGLCYMTQVLYSCNRRPPVYDNGEWQTINDGERIGWYNRVNDTIYGGEVDPWPQYRQVLYMPGVDVQSFEICVGTNYAKDKKHVYYPVIISCFDGEECFGLYSVQYVVEDADPQTFKYIGNGYGVDAKNMYHDGEKITWDDEVVRLNGQIPVIRNNEYKVDTIPW